MEALKGSMQAKGRAKVGDAVRRRMGKPAKEAATPRTSRPTPSSRRTAHWGTAWCGATTLEIRGRYAHT